MSNFVPCQGKKLFMKEVYAWYSTGIKRLSDASSGQKSFCANRPWSVGPAPRVVAGGGEGSAIAAQMRGLFASAEQTEGGGRQDRLDHTSGIFVPRKHRVYRYCRRQRRIGKKIRRWASARVGFRGCLRTARPQLRLRLPQPAVSALPKAPPA